MNQTALERASEIGDWIVAQRRYFHQHPELSYKEYHTTAKVKEELEKMGIETKTITNTGVIGIIEGKAPGKVLGLVADIDALPVKEDTGLPFSSENPGIMHACGHDAHTAMLLGAAKILFSLKEELKGTVKLIFQPAEEEGTGARSIIDAGALTAPDVDSVFRMHAFADLPTGFAVVQEGPLLASADDWKLEITGVQCHGSAPWQGVDANICAAAVVQGLQTIVSRVNDARLPIVLNVGTISGGQRFNITSGKVTLEGMNRTFSEDVRQQLPKWMERMIKGICEAYGCEYKFDYHFLCGAIVNDASMTKGVRSAVQKVIGKERTLQIEKNMGSDDFAEYLLHVPGSYIGLGCGNKAKGCIHPQHSDHFMIDEDALAIGTACYIQTALDYLS